MAFPPQIEENGGGGGAVEEDTTIDIHTTLGAPIRYLPLDHLYSSTSPCSGSSNVMSKKVKARKLNNNSSSINDNNNNNHNGEEIDSPIDNKKTTSSSMVVYPKPKPKPPILFVYSRRRKRSLFKTTPFCNELQNCERTVLKRRKIGSTELERLGVDWNALGKFDGPRLRECRNQIGNSGFDGSNNSNKCGSVVKIHKLFPDSRALKRWVM